MDQPRYYLRRRGTVSGPYELAALGKMLRRGKASRVDQVSVDGANWEFAGKVPELYAPPAPSAPLAVVREREDTPIKRYFYLRDGETTGPVPEPLLLALARNGRLGRDDIVWEEYASVSLPAWRLPVLAAIYTPVTAATGAPPPLARQSGPSQALIVLTIIILFLVIAIPLALLIWKLLQRG